MSDNHVLDCKVKALTPELQSLDLLLEVGHVKACRAGGRAMWLVPGMAQVAAGV